MREMIIFDFIIKAFLLLLGLCVLLFFLTAVFSILYVIDEKFKKYVNKYLDEKGKNSEK